MESQWNVFHRFKDQEPAWTLREGDWTDDFEKCSKDFRATIGEYYLHSCVPYEYVNMRKTLYIPGQNE